MFTSFTDDFVLRFSKTLTFLVLVFSLSNIAFGEILFKDDFEQDTTGHEPSKWKTALGVGKGEVVKDPAGSNSKVFRAPECDERGGDFYLIGEKNWDNYEIMWDWYFVDAIKEGIGTSNNSSLIFRFQNTKLYYLMDTGSGATSPRPKTTDITWYLYNGNWVNFGDKNAFPLENEVWYQAYLIVDKDTFTFKMKKRGDTKSFDTLEPVITGKDGTIKSGQIGTFGPSYFDNVIVGDIGTGPEGLQAGWAVLSLGKLSTTWGTIKSSY